MTHVTCRLTAKNRDQLRNSTLGNRVRATFTFVRHIQVVSSASYARYWSCGASQTAEPSSLSGANVFWTEMNRRHCYCVVINRTILLPQTLVHREAEKKEPFYFCACLFNTGQKLVIFFTYISPKESRSISYNSMYLVLACVKILQRQ